MKKRTVGLLVLALIGACILLGLYWPRNIGNPTKDSITKKQEHYQPRKVLDTSGYGPVLSSLKPWNDPTSLEDIRDGIVDLGNRNLAKVNAFLGQGRHSDNETIQALIFKASFFMYQGQAKQAYQVLEEARSLAESTASMTRELLYTVVFLQGMAALRRGEDENCLQCRGEGACIFPLRSMAVHTNPAGSRLAIRHFTEYLEEFPDDLGVRWLLNLAYMTLGEHPGKVPPDYLINLEHFGIGVRHRHASRTSPTWSASIVSTRPAARSWTILTTTACSTSSSARSTPTSPWHFTATREMAHSRIAPRRPG